MKNIKLFYLLLVSVMLFLSACEPIVEEFELTDTTTVDGVQLVATHTPPGGNKVTLSMVTPGITGYWDYGTGKALTNEVTLVLPFTGKHTFTYVGKLGLTFFTKKIDVQVDRLDTPLDPMYYSLVSNNTTAGKDWVFDGVGGDNRQWFFMSQPNSIKNAMSVWWNAGGTDSPPVDVNGKMNFNLNGALNYNYYATKTGTPIKAGFVLDIPNKKLSFIGGNPKGGILGGERGSKDGVYNIITLTETKMVLYDSQNDGDGTGWTFVFKPL